MKETIHNYPRRLESCMKKINSSSFSESNRKIMLGFKEECFSQGLSIGRVLKYLYYLEKLSLWLGKDFDKASKEDIKKLVGTIEQCQYAKASKKELKVCIKKLYKWLRDAEEYPPEVRWIKPHSTGIERLKLPEDMLTEEDVEKLINAAATPRDKALVSMLYESGCRIAEILFMRLRNIRFDRYGVVLIVPGMKTGSRRVRIVSSVPYLTEWINNHPFRNDPNAYLWISTHNNVISYSRVRLMLTRLGRKTGIKKKLNPHNFRHSRATYLANHLTEAQMKEFFGWTQASDMAAIYVHLSGRDVDNAMLKIYGIKKEDEREKSLLAPKHCPRCQESNAGANKFCNKCGMPLDQETVMAIVQNDLQRKEADNILDELIKDPEFKGVLLRKAKELLQGNKSPSS